MTNSFEPMDELRDFGTSLGFQSLGVTPVGLNLHLDHYALWLASQFHGEMAYMSTSQALRSSPKSLLKDAHSVVAVALNYHQVKDGKQGHPLIAEYALGRDYHRVLRGKLKKLGSWIERRYPGATWRACVDSAPVFEREYAQAAGLGWFGKNTCLIDSKRGSKFFIGLLLTSVILEPSEPERGSCGTCSACIDACPTGAIVLLNGRWSIDSRSCISYLTIEKRSEFTALEEAQIGDWTFGCDVCQDVCPFNQPRVHQPLRAKIADEPDFYQRRNLPSLIALAEGISESEWEVVSRGSSIRRTGRSGLRRNARANLQNLDQAR